MIRAFFIQELFLPILTRKLLAEATLIPSLWSSSLFAMAPTITKWSDFAHVSEEFDSETGEFEYTMFVILDLDDAIYYCEIPTRKAEVSFQQVTASLKPIPFCEAFPEWPLPNGSHASSAVDGRR